MAKIAVMSILLLSACAVHAGDKSNQNRTYLSGSRLKEATNSVKSGLRDPFSAKFKDVFHVITTDATCGLVNAKNSFGGYVGFEPFYYLGKGTPMFMPRELTPALSAAYQTPTGRAKALVELQQEWEDAFTKACLE